MNRELSLNDNLQPLLEHCTDAVIVADNQDTIRYLTPPAAVLLNCTIDECTGKTLDSLPCSLLQRRFPIHWQDEELVFIKLEPDTKKTTDPGFTAIGGHRLISLLCTSVLNTDMEHINSCISDTLKMLAQQCRAQYSCIFTMAPDGKSLSLHHEWNENGDIDTLQHHQNIACEQLAVNLDLEQIASQPGTEHLFTDTIKETAHNTDISAIIDQSNHLVLYYRNNEVRIPSPYSPLHTSSGTLLPLSVVPLFMNNCMSGFIGLDKYVDAEDIHLLLVTSGAILINLIERKRATEEFREHRFYSENIVSKRTEELVKTNEQLNAVIAQRRKSWQRQKAIIDHYPIATIVLSPAKTIDVFNLAAEKLTGYARSEMRNLESLLVQLFSGSNREPFASLVDRILQIEGSELQLGSYSLTRKDQSIITVTIALSQFENGIIILIAESQS